jgi:hypothetical protein
MRGGDSHHLNLTFQLIRSESKMLAQLVGSQKISWVQLWPVVAATNKATSAQVAVGKEIFPN